jgi:hypothetical protein
MEVGEAGFGEVKEEGWLLRGNGVRGGRVVELRCAGSLRTFQLARTSKLWHWKESQLFWYVWYMLAGIQYELLLQVKAP